MRAPRRLGGALVLLWLTLAGPAIAAEWGGITPGETTRREVEGRYGRPTRERSVVEEGRTTSEWTYAGERVPRGLDRMVVTFGLLGPQGFAPDVVRSLTLHAKPRIFTVETLTVGWGKPDAIGTDERTGKHAFRYEARGLLVILDRTQEWGEVLIFAPERRPQP